MFGFLFAALDAFFIHVWIRANQIAVVIPYFYYGGLFYLTCAINIFFQMSVCLIINKGLNNKPGRPYDR
ncbi:hypothetical protein D3260_07755 [Salinisphaera sp. Q1T1-3]|nr:hypothetical protein D3260_07755 [Salinisphaera sp. Q1T1-3]